MPRLLDTENPIFYNGLISYNDSSRGLPVLNPRRRHAEAGGGRGWGWGVVNPYLFFFPPTRIFPVRMYKTNQCGYQMFAFRRRSVPGNLCRRCNVSWAGHYDRCVILYIIMYDIIVPIDRASYRFRVDPGEFFWVGRSAHGIYSRVIIFIIFKVYLPTYRRVH